MQNRNEHAILLLSCPDTKGIVAEVSSFIRKHNGNILDFDQHSDEQDYFMRVEWDMDQFSLPAEDIAHAFTPISRQFDMDVRVEFSSRTLRLAIFVGAYDHCLYDLILHNRDENSQVDIRCMIGNHPQLSRIASDFNIPFHYIETKDKEAAEGHQLKILEQEKIDLIVLARYMQILSEDFVSRYPNRIINIHHSFLPAFTGAKPYHQAYQRGVKIIGATSHYVTADLDQGPIIEQDVTRISHRDSVKMLITKGSDLESRVLTRAVRLHVEHRILSHGNKTIVFL